MCLPITLPFSSSLIGLYWLVSLFSANWREKNSGFFRQLKLHLRLKKATHMYHVNDSRGGRANSNDYEKAWQANWLGGGKVAQANDLFWNTFSK